MKKVQENKKSQLLCKKFDNTEFNLFMYLLSFRFAGYFIFGMIYLIVSSAITVWFIEPLNSDEKIKCFIDYCYLYNIEQIIQSNIWIYFKIIFLPPIIFFIIFIFPKKLQKLDSNLKINKFLVWLFCKAKFILLKISQNMFSFWIFYVYSVGYCIVQFYGHDEFSMYILVSYILLLSLGLRLESFYKRFLAVTLFPFLLFFREKKYFIGVLNACLWWVWAYSVIILYIFQVTIGDFILDIKNDSIEMVRWVSLGVFILWTFTALYGLRELVVKKR
ncbi:hypothetical protein [Helicobacter cetorum]|uniref:Uncharacterized protein n=1 Tax=Helicobacter cetorum (strain ATCC BAA-540 / CCUG 52418 / MIT 99-5656) TaxID=1163745 RepID=I0ERV3_HELCM|nr:hypothetical protein [Helicobacter cetorum]AFI05672.1 hypothetical protein HCD_03280 [Helicobacter cetorum MIT 99-5656]